MLPHLTDLVELPVTCGLDDFPPFEFVTRFSQGCTRKSSVEVIGCWCSNA